MCLNVCISIKKYFYYIIIFKANSMFLMYNIFSKACVFIKPHIVKIVAETIFKKEKRSSHQTQTLFSLFLLNAHYDFSLTFLHFHDFLK